MSANGTSRLNLAHLVKDAVHVELDAISRDIQIVTKQQIRWLLTGTEAMEFRELFARFLGVPEDAVFIPLGEPLEIESGTWFQVNATHDNPMAWNCLEARMFSGVQVSRSKARHITIKFHSGEDEVPPPAIGGLLPDAATGWPPGLSVTMGQKEARQLCRMLLTVLEAAPAKPGDTGS
jgi:hypothetical protein